MIDSLELLKSFYRSRKSKKLNLVWVVYGSEQGKSSTACNNIKDTGNILVYGTTGSGKSMFLHTFIIGVSTICTENDARFVLVDSKKIEFNRYKDNSLLLSPIIHDKKTLIEQVDELLKMCDKRKERNIAFPNILIVIDEYADIACKETNKALAKLVSIGNQCGIYVLLSTQSIKSGVASLDFFKLFKTIICQKTFDVEETKDLVGEYVELKGKGDSVVKRGDMLIHVKCPTIDFKNKKNRNERK